MDEYYNISVKYKKRYSKKLHTSFSIDHKIKSKMHIIETITLLQSLLLQLLRTLHGSKKLKTKKLSLLYFHVLCIMRGKICVPMYLKVAFTLVGKLLILFYQNFDFDHHHHLYIIIICMQSFNTTESTASNLFSSILTSMILGSSLLVKD